LKFGRPLDTPWAFTSPFNAPRDYSAVGGKENDRHEGVDIAPTVGATSRVLAVYDGIVAAVKSSPGYGNYVIVSSQYNSHTFQTWRAHMASVVVAVGQKVQMGDVLGVCDSTGNSTGRHDHLTMTSVHGGLSGYIVANVVDPTPFYPAPGAPQPQPAAVDMASYFFPAAGGFGDICILKNNWGAGDERQQLQRDGEESFVTKNQQWERRRITVAGVHLEMDTSPGEGEYYTCSGLGFPRSWRPGDTFTRSERIGFFRKSDCKPVATKPPYTQTSTIRFQALHSLWTSPAGIKLINVAELAWIVNGAIEERYWYAPHLGLVQWKNKAGRHSWIVERIPLGQQGNNVREVLPCAG
jgi:hypothetical protein